MGQRRTERIELNEVTTATRERAATLLCDLAGDDAALRDDQAEAIGALVDECRRALVVQRTGWGKSAVYFIATRLRRDAGAGPTLLVSPLLALMRDQIAAAQRIGLAAETINSTNVGDWQDVASRTTDGGVDLLLISPERLNHPGFRRDVLEPLAGHVGMVVIDEAHCISDWGHDFRPDYRRIRDVLAALPDGTPVLATTATANERVIADVADQLGADPITLRGDLDRASLVLDLRDLGGMPERLAWLADWVPTTPGSGIVYCLTVADAERAAQFLAAEGLDAVAYTGRTDPAERERIEALLVSNEVAVVCATTALGMGYDKPDLAFVAHLGLPASPIAYYQAIGRAGRALDRAEVVALPGPTDERIWEHFERQALPSESRVREVLDALTAYDEPVSTAKLERDVNLRRTMLELVLKVTDVDGAVDRVDGGWVATGRPWRPDPERLARVRAAREAEAEAMRTYRARTGCLMAFLRAELDDTDGRGPDDPAVACGRCARCTGERIGPSAPDPDRVSRAQRSLRGRDVVLDARRQWPVGLADRRGRLAHPPRPGRALAIGADHGWEHPLDLLLEHAGDPRAGGATAALRSAFAEVLDGLVAVLARWDWDRRPTWIATVPSRRRGPMVAAIADELATRGRLERADPLVRVDDTAPQRPRANSSQQVSGALAALGTDPDVTLPAGPCLLIDDVAHSRWTVAVAAELLGEAGADEVLPLVLHHDP
ncbi:ATP-dependent DNA helicase RecQ [Egibacter rhizosphaerae]|uniref:DNA 3'-5' helicase n=1 Tax=Egibacter rhizosphaerae TaxID=1670831 RepID=A0A411YEL9_9ACTN|nr:RecQ family ATP-dependent DNA helicase [Egibacter rhizosphaerae]QBI19537.1 ATP-dependent DNA helicase RecQ [Egibacter rhizosphaerae]